MFPVTVMKQSLAVDALGLRPLWMLETESSYLFSSEPGIVPSSEFVNDPKPLAPGEKVGFKWDGDELKYFIQEDYQEEVYRSFFKANSVPRNKESFKTFHS